MSRTDEEEPEAIRRLKAVYRKVGTHEAKKNGQNVQLTPADVVVAGPRKNGNTWTKQIVHGLRSRGNMDFEEISIAIPELEYASDYGCGDIRKRQKYQPQVYHTHLSYHEIPRGGKYIVIVRDPFDSAVSLYHYWKKWLFDPGEINVDDLTKYFWLGREDSSQNTIPCQMQYMLDWYPSRGCQNVLWLHFEDLKADVRYCVKLIAGFLGIDQEDEELIDLVSRQADISFMQEHKQKFNSSHIKGAYNLAMGLNRDAGHANGKVRSGQVGSGKQYLSKSVIELINKRWKQTIGKKLGFETYSDMRASINKELGRHFLQSFDRTSSE